MTIEKRQSLRIEVLGELQGRAILLDAPVTIMQMSLGGLTIATTFPFPSGSSQEFQITLGLDSAVVRGRVLHQRVSIEGDENSYISGIEFINVNAELSATLRRFMARFNDREKRQERP